MGVLSSVFLFLVDRWVFFISMYGHPEPSRFDLIVILAGLMGWSLRIQVAELYREGQFQFPKARRNMGTAYKESRTSHSVLEQSQLSKLVTTCHSVDGRSPPLKYTLATPMLFCICDV